MENASKALTMAGGILIALMIISLLVYMFTQLAKSSEEQEMAKRTAQIVAFNDEYESFNRKDVYGAELISLVNKMMNYNIKEADEKGYLPMNMTIKFIVDKEGLFQARLVDNVKEMKELIKQAEEEQKQAEKEAKEQGSYLTYIPFSEIKRKLFKCTKAEYDDATGRITVMHFEEINTAKT